MIRLFYWLYRLLSRREKPLLQLLLGVLLIPVGAAVAYAACSGEYIYPYWVILGGGLAFFGLALLLKGLIILLSRKGASAAAASPSAREPVAGPDLQASLAGQPFSSAASLSPQSGRPRQMPAGSAAAAAPSYGAVPAGMAGQSPAAFPSQLSWWGGTPWPGEQMGYPGYQPQPGQGQGQGVQTQAKTQAPYPPQRLWPPEVSSR
ncbi:hypothetical protein [Thermogemmatispora carboxidivorans]|uniref:hypothetical protein n=1 Tax=Thermogemmatispora carboxidivorans TaxID=1382306 RepID=UPI000699A49D|nr:hypothetical protein [Thermogemmatispora carboxidivorans]